MNVFVAGNDEKLVNIYDFLLHNTPDLNVCLIIDDKLFNHPLYHQKLSKEALEKKKIPTIFSAISRIDTTQKKIILSNSGEIAYDIFIYTHINIPAIPIPKPAKNIYFNTASYEKDYQSKESSDIPVLVIASQSTANENIIGNQSLDNFIKYNSNEIKELHYYDDKVTSATLKSNDLVMFSAIIILDMQHIEPAFIKQLNIPKEQLQEQDIFSMEHTSNQDILPIIKKIKPKLTYYCIKNLKYISKCKGIENAKGTQFCTSHELCQLTNQFSDQFNEHDELRVTENLFQSYAKKKNEALKKIKNWLIKARQATFRRWYASGCNSSYFEDMPQELLIMDTLGYIPHQDAIEQSMKWILNTNHELIDHLSNPVMQGERRFLSGSGNTSREEKFILYTGSNIKNFKKIIELYQESNVKVKIITMGCAGLEISMKYGYPHAGGYYEQSFIPLMENCAGVIIDLPCIKEERLHKLSQHSKKMIDSAQLSPHSHSQEWISFFNNCQDLPCQIKNNEKRMDLKTHKTKINTCSEKELKTVKKWLFLPPCSGNITDDSLFSSLQSYLQDNFAVYTCGCALSTLINGGYYSDYLPEDSYELYGNGSYINLVQTAKKIESKEKILLFHGPIIIDAWIDALILKYIYNFSIASYDSEVIELLHQFDQIKLKSFYKE